MSAGDSARKFVELAKHEAIERIRLRDNVLLLYLGAVATIFSLALNKTNAEMLLSIPFLALGATVIVCQHNLVIGDLSVFCAFEIGAFLRSLNPSEDAPQWDGSKSLKTWHSCAIRMRTIGHSHSSS